MATEKNTLRQRLSFTNDPWFSAVVPLIVLFAAMSIIKPDTFLTSSNIMNVLRQSSTYAIMAVGMSFAIITGGIDLSQGSVLAVVAIVVGIVIRDTESIFLAVAAGIAVGAAVGVLNGAVVAFLGVPAFIMTLGTMRAMRGVALLITNGTPIDIKMRAFRVVGVESLFGIPIPVYLFVAVALAAQFILSQTATGRYIFALGSNEEAAKISGVRISANRIKAYLISGVCVAIAAILYISRLGSAQPIAGESYELESVAAAVIGGTSIVGGEGSAIGSIIGAVVVALIRNGMVLLQISTYWQSIVIGMVIVVSVSIDILRKRIEASRVS
ncbi:MAG: ABC transporter permease [Synergistaceae bacterium]|jgi:ribose transport system permease protein|nr:ABC transporter permease [Synergistaceae bacterium]